VLLNTNMHISESQIINHTASIAASQHSTAPSHRPQRSHLTTTEYMDTPREQATSQLMPRLTESDAQQTAASSMDISITSMTASPSSSMGSSSTLCVLLLPLPLLCSIVAKGLSLTTSSISSSVSEVMRHAGTWENVGDVTWEGVRDVTCKIVWGVKLRGDRYYWC
jgi:hypothetical protein